MKKGEDLCVICNVRIATSDDHIPPKNLFPKPRPNNLITVRACDICNGGSSKNDELFRVYLVLEEKVAALPQTKKLIDSFSRSLMRPQAKGFKQGLSDSLIKANIGTNIKDAMLIKNEIIEHEFQKIIRGLFYSETKKILTDNYIVNGFEITEEGFIKHFKTHDFQIKRAIGKKVFNYCVTFDLDDEENYTSTWILSFYEKRHFFYSILLSEIK